MFRHSEKNMEMTLEEYIEELKWIYINARWEAYYELAIIPLLKRCCTQQTKVVPIHATRKSGRKSSREHFIEKYSYVDNDGKRRGIPDYVIVPLESTYDNPKEAVVFIEFKSPIGLNDNYVPIRIERYSEELKSQSNVCNYIVFTDGITWYFGHKEKKGLIWSPNSICLIEDKWEELKEAIVDFIKNACKEGK